MVFFLVICFSFSDSNDFIFEGNVGANPFKMELVDFKLQIWIKQGS